MHVYIYRTHVWGAHMLLLIYWTHVLISPASRTLHPFAEGKLPALLSLSPCFLKFVILLLTLFLLSLSSFIHLNNQVLKAQSSIVLGSKTVNLNKNQHLLLAFSCTTEGLPISTWSKKQDLKLVLKSGEFFHLIAGI